MFEITTWRLLIVDDDEEICKQVKEILEDEEINNVRLSIIITTDFNDALEILENQRIDLIILDVREGSHDDNPSEEIGIITLNKIKEKCFLPIIFNTGLPNLVEHLRSNLIRIVRKGKSEELWNEINNVFTSNLPIINRALVHHFEEIQRQYMWEFIADNWQSISRDNDNHELAHLLARRISLSLSAEEILSWVSQLGFTSKDSIKKEEVSQSHPITYYLIPPISNYPRPGDLYVKDKEDNPTYWVILNPSCDFIIRKNGKCKVEYILLANASKLSDQEEYKSWCLNYSNSQKKKLIKLIQDNREGQSERFYFLPGVCDFPDLIVDFQVVVSIKYDDLSNGAYNRLASLDSPHAEALLTRFSRYFGRVGKPDLDAESILSKLQEVISKD
ncbi:response regulator [Acaryochloris marina]|uniref:Response regulator reciever domain protein n=1 Tax=Acaryochloris marina (strain MBIC 11017) TaxID=329726 RepID=A8ZK28_ACAM1|nr:response regulator [Acaryochloris marina]ABW31528.1 response regulator reciever domain protein [Acaryochloris marina MBIC11017]